MQEVLWGCPGWRRTGRASARILRTSRTLGHISSACTHAADATLACTHKHKQTHRRVYHTLHACMCTQNTAVVLSRGTEVMTMRWGGSERELGRSLRDARGHHVLLGRGVPDGGGDGGGSWRDGRLSSFLACDASLPGGQHVVERVSADAGPAEGANQRSATK